jgi:hypothetical protein
MGLGLGGFIDGIVLHQVLQWHHRLTSTGEYPMTTVAGLEANTLADGFFHLLTWKPVTTTHTEERPSEPCRCTRGHDEQADLDSASSKYTGETSATTLPEADPQHRGTCQRAPITVTRATTVSPGARMPPRTSHQLARVGAPRRRRAARAGVAR